jgi:AcrR family transcriptional regulator
VSDSWARARREHRSQQEQTIASAALGLLTERGAGSLSMAAIAEAAAVSRPTLYRYYRDVDAVLTGIADLIASHDDLFEQAVTREPDPAARLDLLLGSVAAAGDHAALTTALHAALPPEAREVLTRHESRIRRVLTETLEAGVDSGAFRRDLSPAADAPLLLGLARAADRGHAHHAVALAHRLVDPTPQERTS